MANDGASSVGPTELGQFARSLPDSLGPSILGRFVIGFCGPSPPDWIRRLLGTGLTGVILFKRNIESESQLKSLSGILRESAGPVGLPPLVAVDEEGGPVRRLAHVIDLVLPSARQMAEGGTSTCFDCGRQIARRLRAAGINCDLAPVLDVDTNPRNPIIGPRAFSSDPHEAGILGMAFARGLSAEGVLPCGKHFPGHGDASADSHEELPQIAANERTLSSRELVPFRMATSLGIPMLMTAHCLYPVLDRDHPATLSRRIIGGVLRRHLGFHGCVITDDLAMNAISMNYSPQEVLVLGNSAGVDLFLVCGDDGLVLRYLMAAATRRELWSSSAHAESVERILALRRRLLAKATSPR